MPLTLKRFAKLWHGRRCDLAMRFGAIKNPGQQAELALHRARDLIVKQRTQLINMIRGILREFGCGFPKGPEAAMRYAKAHLEGDHPEGAPAFACSLITTLCDQLLALQERLKMYAKLIEQHSFVDKTA